MESPEILKMEGCASSQPRFSIPVTTERDPPLTENRSVQRLSNGMRTAVRPLHPGFIVAAWAKL